MINKIFSAVTNMFCKSDNETKSENPQPEQPHDEVKTPEQPKQPEQSETPKVEQDGKAHVYNLIIVDESGSMGHLREATLSGVNETINGIRQAQEDFGDKQTHHLTLVTFDAPGRKGIPVRTIIDAKPIAEVFGFADYNPCGGTPLYDAMGQSINRLYQLVKEDPDATAVVTVMTDGMENASREYSGRQLKALIEKLKEEGWTFNYMGSAHDVKSVTDLLSIENVVEFSHDDAGTRATWQRERMAKKRFFERLNTEWEAEACKSEPERRESRKQRSKDFYVDL